MKIVLAKTAGFCMGVKRAVQIALETARGTEDIFTCGPLIHNPQAVETLREKGIVPLPDDIDPDHGILLIRAHGMPADRIARLREKGLQIIDATCPHVVSSQDRIRKFSEEGYTILIVGDREHPEILSLQSFAVGPCEIISSLAEARAFAGTPRAMVIAQTTFNAAEYQAICTELAGKVPQYKVFQSICKATSRRQDEVQHLAATCDAVVVVGGRNSANTRRLAEIAAAAGKPAFHVETAAELPLAEFAAFAAVGVTAGASTPDWVTQEVIDRLQALIQERP